MIHGISLRLGVVKQRVELRLGRVVTLERLQDRNAVAAEMHLGQIGTLRVISELGDATEDELVDDLVRQLMVKP